MTEGMNDLSNKDILIGRFLFVRMTTGYGHCQRPCQRNLQLNMHCLIDRKYTTSEQHKSLKLLFTEIGLTTQDILQFPAILNFRETQSDKDVV